MQAIKYNQYGSHDVLKIEQSEKPTPKENEILVRIRAASITRADTMMRRGNPYLGRLMLGLTKQKYTGVGTGFAGEIEAIGTGVSQFKVGDPVFGESVIMTNNTGISAQNYFRGALLQVTQQNVIVVFPDHDVIAAKRTEARGFFWLVDH